MENERGSCLDVLRQRVEALRAYFRVEIATGDGVERVRVERVAVGQAKAKLGRSALSPGPAIRTRGRLDPDPTPTQRHLARRRHPRGRPARSRSRCQRGPHSSSRILLHHGVQHLLARADAQIEIRAFDADERPQQRGGTNLRRRLPPWPCGSHSLEMAGLLGMLFMAVGWNFGVVWLPPSYYTKGEEAAESDLYCVRDQPSLASPGRLSATLITAFQFSSLRQSIPICVARITAIMT